MPRLDEPPVVPDPTRTLANYRMQHINEAFPLLSMVYAILAGGEHTIYCDYTHDYTMAYLGASQHLQHVQEFIERLAQFEEMADKNGDGIREFVVHATPEDWEYLLKRVLVEVQAAKTPMPIW